jgi:quercetin dioxygenase-like cupin family protein
VQLSSQEGDRLGRVACVITLDGVPHTLQVGDTVYLAAGVEASCVARSDGPTRVLQVWAPQGPEARCAAWSAPEQDR